MNAPASDHGAPSFERKTPSCRETLLVAAAYTALTLWWLWPLVRVLSTHSVNMWEAQATRDFYLIVWALAWSSHALVTAPFEIFHANSFYPSQLSLAYSDHFLGYLPVFSPAYWITTNPILAINLVIVTSYPLCAVAMYLLARRFTKAAPAAVAGFFYAFCLARYMAPPHVHMLGVQYLPLAILLTERWLERSRTRDAALLTGTLLIQALSSVYLAYGMALVFGPYLLMALWRWRARCDRRRLVGIAVALLVALVVMAAVSLPYFELKRLGFMPAYGKGGPLPLGLIFSGKPVWHYLRHGGVGPVGYALVAVAVLPLGLRGWWPVLIGLMTAAVGTVMAFGPFGPSIPIAGGHLLSAPYRLLMDWVPGFASVRFPGRFTFVGHLGFALLAGLGFGRLLGRLPSGIRWAAAFTIVALALRTFGPLPPMLLRLEPTGDRVPRVYGWLREHGDGRALLELPRRGAREEGRRMYLSVFHWLPIVGGHSGYPPGTDKYIYQLARGLPAEPALQAVVDTVDIGWVLVHLDQLPEQRARSWKGPLPRGLEPVGTWEGDLLLRVTRPVKKDRRARLLSRRETLGGVPLEPLGKNCPGALRLVLAPPDPWPPRASAELQVEVLNTGASPWPAWGFVPRHLVKLRACVVSSESSPCLVPPVDLPADVPAGGRVIVPVTLKAPFSPGSYRLELSLVQLDTGPLDRCGVEPIAIPVHVARARD